MTGNDLLLNFIQFALLIPAIVFHEVAHGYSAYLLGDPTAKMRGRLSLNPVRHIDPFGTILLPILLVFAFGFGFGYAKPVPIDTRRFADYRKGMLITGLAGPATNFTLALLAGLAYRAVAPLAGMAGTAFVWAAYLLFNFALLNLVLMFFNLIPLPPLDGSRVLPLFLSDRAMVTYHRWERYGFIILFLFLWFAPRLLGFNPIGSYFSVTVQPMLRLLTGT